METVAQRWALFHRWGPLALLGVGTLVALSAADAIGMSRRAEALAGALVGAALLLELGWHVVGRNRSTPGPASGCYYGLRWACGFTLTWLNPLFAFYAVIGYFSAERLLPRRVRKAGLLATAVTVAGSQAGGLPPRGGTGWLVFGAILGVNVLLLALFAHLAALEDARARAQAEAITELERTNGALQRALDENAALHAQLLVQAREAGVADERRRLAAEIHDTIAQGLTGIIAQLQVVAGAHDLTTARTHLERASALARHSLGEARRSVHNLVPVALASDGLPRALRSTVEEWSARTGVPARFTVTGTEEVPHDEISATLLRIAQEALSNTARHAGATRAGVTLSFMGDEVVLDIRDDGGGFDPAAVPARGRSGGFGLDGMRARAERVAGSLAVESEPGQGTAVSARVPLVRDDR
ncbi:sensor histidine kinase [Streptomyces sp. J2-1]|uniref:sensor histidine kinase n=1 Tax=Streptomyces corallincola TaxID=2851888 RepID=UPI001C38163E|nr:sensor histidine kinase [Streptomyces corallincola]MBV2353344.1 sensor histidine kinase [Streptomyces corallincola]